MNITSKFCANMMEADTKQPHPKDQDKAITKFELIQEQFFNKMVKTLTHLQEIVHSQDNPDSYQDMRAAKTNKMRAKELTSRVMMKRQKRSLCEEEDFRNEWGRLLVTIHGESFTDHITFLKVITIHSTVVIIQRLSKLLKIWTQYTTWRL